MVEKNILTYDAWKEYLKNDKEMDAKWKSLIALWKNVKKDLEENLKSMPYSEALRRRKYLTAKNIFNVINTAKQKPNFSWFQKVIYNEEDGHHELVIQCKDPSSDYIFRKIKEERWVASMFWSSIDRYLQPVANKIWALKDTLRVSINPETNNSDLSYDSLKIKKPIEMPEWIENHYTGDDENIVNEDGDVVLNPKYEHVPVENPEVIEDENNTVSKEGELKKEVGILKGWMKVEKDVQENKENGQRKEPRQLEIPFDDLE